MCDQLEKEIKEMDALELLCLVIDCPSYMTSPAYVGYNLAICLRVEILNAEREN